MTALTLPLETELFLFGEQDRDSRIVARHYGLDGEGGANFQRIGDEVGLTRERVRQIVSEADPKSYLRPGGLPALDRVIAAVASILPAPAAMVEGELQARGLTTRAFRLEGIIEIATLLRRPAPFRVMDLDGRRMVIASDYPRFHEVVSGARQKVRRYGVACLRDCLPQSRNRGNQQRELKLLETLLSAQDDFRWLQRESGWFWFSDAANNRVATRIRKMLAVANPLGIAEARAGLLRMGDPLPPNDILLEFCRQLPDLSVDGNTIRAEAEISIGEVLNRTERDIFQLLAENDGCMSNSELICRSRVLGIKRPTFYQCVTWSPIVLRYKRSHYRLIGSRQSMGAAAGS